MTTPNSLTLGANPLSEPAARAASTPTVTASTSAAAAASPAGNPLLTGKVLPTLLRLAVPNVLAMTTTVLVGVAETFYVGRLGVGPLAAMALVFPFNMLTGMMSAGAMGGGVSSSVSRALGAGKVAQANASAVHATLIGGGIGIVYSIFFLLCGPLLYSWLGGRDHVLAQAVGYSSVLFCGAALLWMVNTLASILRGTGNMKIPSVTMMLMAPLQIAVGGVLGLGIGSFEGWGMPGIAIGQIIANGAGAIYLYWYLATGQGKLKLRWRGTPISWALFVDILKVGAVACLSPLQSVLTVLILTGLIARLGVLPLAGYGIGQRLEFLLIPIAFGIGVASVPMVGMAIGAGNVARARTVAWTAGALSAFNLGLVGLLVALLPQVWAGIFTSDAGVLGFASQYLHWAGPAFSLFGLGLTLYFASQGASKVFGPVLASTLRLLLVGGVGYWLSTQAAPAWQYFALVGAAMVVYGLGTALAVWITPWGRRA